MSQNHISKHHCHTSNNFSNALDRSLGNQGGTLQAPGNSQGGSFSGGGAKVSSDALQGAMDSMMRCFNKSTTNVRSNSSLESSKPVEASPVPQKRRKKADFSKNCLAELAKPWVRLAVF